MNAMTLAALIRAAIEIGQDLVARGEMSQADLDEALAAARAGQTDAIDSWRDRMDRIGRS